MVLKAKSVSGLKTAPTNGARASRNGHNVKAAPKNGRPKHVSPRFAISFSKAAPSTTGAIRPCGLERQAEEIGITHQDNYGKLQAIESAIKSRAIKDFLVKKGLIDEKGLVTEITFCRDKCLVVYGIDVEIRSDVYKNIKRALLKILSHNEDGVKTIFDGETGDILYTSSSVKYVERLPGTFMVGYGRNHADHIKAVCALYLLSIGKNDLATHFLPVKNDSIVTIMDQAISIQFPPETRFDIKDEVRAFLQKTVIAGGYSVKIAESLEPGRVNESVEIHDDNRSNRDAEEELRDRETESFGDRLERGFGASSDW